MPTYLSSYKETRSSETEDVYTWPKFLYLFRDESWNLLPDNARTASNIHSFYTIILDNTISYCNAICCLFFKC